MIKFVGLNSSKFSLKFVSNKVIGFVSLIEGDPDA